MSWYDRAEELLTPRLVLRAADAGDAHDLFAVARDPRSIEDYQRPPDSVGTVARWIEEARGADTPTWIVRRRAGAPVGLVELAVREDAIGTLGYFVSASEQSQGLATEAVGAVVTWAFAQGLHRIEAEITATNTSSIRVVEKLGFRYEGRMRRAWRWDDEWHDTVLWSRLVED